VAYVPPGSAPCRSWPSTTRGPLARFACRSTPRASADATEPAGPRGRCRRLGAGSSACWRFCWPGPRPPEPVRAPSARRARRPVRPHPLRRTPTPTPGPVPQDGPRRLASLAPSPTDCSTPHSYCAAGRRPRRGRRLLITMPTSASPTAGRPPGAVIGMKRGGLPAAAQTRPVRTSCASMPPAAVRTEQIAPATPVGPEPLGRAVSVASAGNGESCCFSCASRTRPAG